MTDDSECSGPGRPSGRRPASSAAQRVRGANAGADPRGRGRSEEAGRTPGPTRGDRSAARTRGERLGRPAETEAQRGRGATAWADPRRPKRSEDAGRDCRLDSSRTYLARPVPIEVLQVADVGDRFL